MVNKILAKGLNRCQFCALLEDADNIVKRFASSVEYVITFK